ncbi:hypothetical protein LJB42_004840 [Komagataella kurtzmanii]|nr:hypothetical protein LJB42_004840 [Komagataella kurtzmanii]
MSESLVASIYVKIASLLPQKTGVTVSDLEIDPYFSSCRNSLFKISETNLFSEMFYQTSLILENINRTDRYVPLSERSATSLSSISIMISLLADISDYVWARQNGVVLMNHSSNMQKTAVLYAETLGQQSSRYYRVHPRPIDDTHARKAVYTISKFRSNTKLVQTINKFKQDKMEPAVANAVIQEIDRNTNFILEFLSGSNKDIFFEFVSSKLQILRKRTSEESDIVPHIDILSLVLLDQQYFLKYVKLLWALYDSIRKPIHQRLILSFMATSLRHWIICNPRDYLGITDDSVYTLELELFFDFLYRKQEFFYDPPRQMMLMLLVMSLPKHLESFLEPSVQPSRLRIKKAQPVSNKFTFLDFMFSSLKDEDFASQYLPHTFEGLIALICIGAIVSVYRPDNALVKLASKYLQDFGTALSIETPDYMIQGIDTQKCHAARYMWYASAMQLERDTFSTRVAFELSSPTTPVSLVTIITAAINVLSSIPAFDSAYFHYSKLCSRSLENHLLRAASIIGIDTEWKYNEVEFSEQSREKRNSNDSLVDMLQALKTSPSSHSTTPTPKIDEGSLSNEESQMSTSYSSSTLPLKQPTPSKIQRTKDTLKSHLSLTSKSPSHDTDSSRANASMLSRTPKPSRLLTSIEPKPKQMARSILFSLLSTLDKYPFLLTFDRTGGEIENNCRVYASHFQEFAVPIVFAMLSNDKQIAEVAQNAVLSFFYPSKILCQAQSWRTYHFLYCTLSVNIVASVLIENKMTKEKDREVLEVLVSLLDERRKLGFTFDPALKFYHRTVCRDITCNVEVALLYSLFTTTIETYDFVKRGFRDFMLEHRSGIHFDSCYSSVDKLFYSLISEDTKIPPGRVALQKKLIEILRTITSPSRSFIKAWTLLYDNWKKSTNEERRHEYAIILCVVCGVFITYDPSNIKQKERLLNQTNTLIDDVMHAAYSSNADTRKRAKSCLEYLHPGTMGILLERVKSDVGETHDIFDWRDAIIADNTVTVLTSMLSQPAHAYRYFSDIISILEVVFNNVLKNEYGLTVIRLQITAISCLSLLHSYKDDYNLTSFILMRNKFADFVSICLEGAMSHLDIISKMDTTEQDSKDIEHYSFDLVLGAVKYLAIGFYELPLDVLSSSNHLDHKSSLNVMFKRYFTLLLKVMERFSYNVSENSYSKHQALAVSEYTIKALTNLLRSNVEIGLRYALKLGFSEDQKTRLAFINVFANIVEDVTEEFTESSDESSDENLFKILQLLIEYGPLVFAMMECCPHSEVDSLVNSFLSLPFKIEESRAFISHLIDYEITNTDSDTELLRYNTFSAKLIGNFAKVYGTSYLRSLLGSVFSEIKDSHDYFNVFDNFTNHNEKPNADLLMKYTRMLVSSLESTISSLPHSIRMICSLIKKATSRKFPESSLLASGAFLFLRFITPSIIEPAWEVFSDPPPMQLRKQLAKVIQAMANNSVSSLKSDTLSPYMNELADLTKRVQSFIDVVSTYDNELLATHKSTYERKEYTAGLRYLHYFIYHHLLSIRSRLIKPKNPHLGMSLDATKVLFDQLKCILLNLGVPKHFGNKVSDLVRNDTSETGSRLNLFLTKHSLIEVPPDQPIIAREYLTDDRVRSAIIELVHFAELDVETILYQILNVLSNLWDSNFEIMFDCTGLQALPGDKSEKLLTSFNSLIPPFAFGKCNKITYFNPSTKIYQFYNNKLAYLDKLVFLSPNLDFHFKSFEDNLHFDESQYTIRVREDPRVTFSNVKMAFEPTKEDIPIKLRIGNEFVHFVYKRNIFNHTTQEYVPIVCIDIVNVADLTEVVTGENDEVYLFNSATGSRIVLKSPKKIEIMRTLYYVKPSSVDVVSKAHMEDEFSLNSFLGLLLNLDFVGLLSRDTEIRKASYNLLVSLAHYFKLDFSRTLSSTEELSLPQDYLPYVASLSESLAKFHPEITLEFVGEFFFSYEHASKNRKMFVPFILRPWVRNIYEYVYVQDPELGPDRVSDLLKKIIRLTIQSPSSQFVFRKAFWSEICMNNELHGLIIQELVHAALDHEAEGKDWDHIISLVHLSPSIEICGHVIHLLIGSAKTFSSDINEIAVHSNWIKISVLCAIADNLLFDCLKYALAFLPEILFIVSLYMDLGPSRLRRSLYGLTVNTLHSLLSNDKLSSESKTELKLLLSKVSDDRGKMLFGLSHKDDSRSNGKGSGDFIKKIGEMEHFCQLVMRIPRLVGDQGLEMAATTKWNSYVINFSFNWHHLFQVRGLVMLGCLSSQGVSDTLLYKVVSLSGSVLNSYAKKHYHWEAPATGIVLAIAYALGKLVEGLPTSSQLIGKMFWHAFALCIIRDSTNYQMCLVFFTKAILKLSERAEYSNIDCFDALLEEKKVFGEALDNVEKLYEIHLSRDSFDIVILSFLGFGLRMPSVKLAAYKCLVQIAAVRCSDVVISKLKSSEERFCPARYSYLAFVYLISRTDERMIEYLENCGIKDPALIKLSNSISVPSQLIDFLATESPHAVFTLYHCALSFNECANDESVQLRFLELFKYISKKHPYLKWMIYPQIIQRIRHINAHSLFLRLLESSMELSSQAARETEYGNIEKHNKELFNMIKEHGLFGITLGIEQRGCFSLDPSTNDEIGMFLRIILDRIICSSSD